MKEFSTVELVRDIRTVTIAANRAPVAITQHRKPRYVLMSVEDFERLARQADSQRAYGPGEAPAEVADLFAEAIDDFLSQPAQK
ncbi:type II toxin-antitoxin system Phd/YefM family antitoxin [Zavarzinia sp.]|uniref:type II toxin-antitoxin system Phd/YefM family antitoxin n=1 Tax=Zavarzinia sp. TaxID=2027920 RepID=UPI003BB6AB69